MNNRILIVDPVHLVLVDLLAAAGYICNYKPEFTREQIIAELPHYIGVVVRTKTIFDKELIDSGTQLQFIARAGAGMDNVDEVYALQKGIICFNAPEGNKDAVAEHVIGLMLTLFNKISKSNAEVRNHIWDREGNRGIELGGKTIGIIGYGNTGKALARKLSGFDVKVLAYDMYLTNYTDNYAIESSLEELQSEAEVISLHVPLTTETQHYYNYAFFNTCKQPVYLINTCRGEVALLVDILRLIKEGKLAGAGLDVLPNEKLDAYTPEEHLVFNELLQFSNVIITPHVAGWSVESFRKISEVLAQKIITFLSKRK